MTSFGPVLRVAAVMRRFPRPWFVAGGWAIDLSLGSGTREHDDVDVAIFRADQSELRTYLASWAFDKVVGGTRTPWPTEERLELPVHEIHARSPNGSQIEFLLNESSGATWRFRRNPAITRPLDRIGARTSAGVPFLVPEIVLLFKAKEPKAKGLRDFELVRPRLEAKARSWLKDALDVCHPGHPWIAHL